MIKAPILHLASSERRQIQAPKAHKALVAEWIHFTLLGIILPTITLTVYTFWDNITHYKTKSVGFLGAYELSN